MLIGDLFSTRSQPEICGYFNVQIRVTNGVNSKIYMVIDPHAYVTNIPDEVAYPIEPSRYVLSRITIVFQIGAPEHETRDTLWR